MFTATCEMFVNGKFQTVTYTAQTRTEAWNWLKFNRDWSRNPQINGVPVVI